MIFFSLSLSAPYLATPHWSLQRIGCKHIPSYFAFPITDGTSLFTGSLLPLMTSLSKLREKWPLYIFQSLLVCILVYSSFQDVLCICFLYWFHFVGFLNGVVRDFRFDFCVNKIFSTFFISVEISVCPRCIKIVHISW